MITQAQLLKSHYYNPETGLFYKRMKAGQLKEVGCDNGHGYLRTTIAYRQTLIHQLIWLYMTGTWPNGYIDHIDNVRKNNAWSNLRLGSQGENLQNRKVAMPYNKSTGLLGTAQVRSGKFTASICLDYKVKHLGTFDTPEEAHQAYIKAKRELHSFNTL